MGSWRLLAVLVMAALLTSCGGGGSSQPGAVEWRNLAIELPESWYLFEDEDTRLSISNADLGPREEGEELSPPDEDVVAMFFTFEPRSLPEDWRDFVDEQDAELETDRSLELAGDVPATQLVFSYVTDGVETREMVVLIPSRRVVILSQPVPSMTDERAPEVFLEHIDTFMEVIESIEFGAPVLE